MLKKEVINWKLIFLGIFALFRSFGLCPIKNDKYRGSEVFNRILIVWSFFNIGVVGALIYITCVKFVHDQSDNLVNFNNILTFSIIILTHFIVLIESLWTRNNFIKIWKNIEMCDVLIRKLIDGYDEILKSFYKKVSIKILSFVIITCVLELLIIFNIQNDASWSFLWKVTFLSSTVSRFRHLQYTIYIEILACRFKIIKRELNSIVMLTKVQNNQLISRNFQFIEGLSNKINSIKKIYSINWEISLLINKSFGISQIANFLQNFVQLTCDLYVMYSFLYVNDLTYIKGNYFLNS